MNNLDCFINPNHLNPTVIALNELLKTNLKSRNLTTLHVDISFVDALEWQKLNTKLSHYYIMHNAYSEELFDMYENDPCKFFSVLVDDIAHLIIKTIDYNPYWLVETLEFIESEYVYDNPFTFEWSNYVTYDEDGVA